jgi:hypothetical protein
MSHVLSKGCYDAQENRTTTSQKGRRMSSLGSFAALTAGAFAIAAVSFPSFAAGPRDHTVVTTEFSAENKPDDKNKKVVPKGAVQKQAPVHVAPRVIERHNGPPAGTQKNIGQQKNFEVKKKIEVQKKIEVHKDIGVQKDIGTQKTIKLQKTVGKPKVFTPHGKNAGIVITSKIRGAPTRGAFRTSIRGRNYSLWRSGYRARYHGGWRTFVALSTLGAITIGAAEYYPYAYIDAPADYCDGLTEDGCQMIYDEVETEEGDVVPQCVAYCPWQQ